MSYIEIKNNIIEKLRTTADIAEEIGSKSIAENIRHERIEKLQKERFHVVVLGEFNHGKSTFVNAILGDEVLPAGITPTTAAINHIVHGSVRAAKVRYRNGDERKISIENIGDWVTTKLEDPDKVAYVEVAHPSPILKGNVTLVDTPGVNDLNEQRAEITYGYVPRADAVLFLLDASQALKESEREFLTSHILEVAKDRLIFVLGKIDVLNGDERAEVQSYVKKSLDDIFEREMPLFSLSAKAWLDHQDETAGMPEFLTHLKTFLESDRMRLLLSNAAKDAERVCHYVEHNLALKKNALELGVDELERRAAKVKEQLAASQKDLAELHLRIKSEAGAMKTQVNLDLQTFTRDFIAALPAQIDSVHSGDLKSYLPGYLEDTFRNWAVQEGEKLAAHMKSLSEDVISVTNQSVASVSQVAAEQLTPEDTEINIDINSLKYDVGIYAIGALGTTVFLFVNTLAGGLLTLAAPILSIMLKSKVDGDIKEQAKQRAPEAIERAAAAVKPHFEQCIDDFEKRLSSFVTTAGNSLYKGISELLSSTLEERKAAKEDISQVVSQVTNQQKKVEEISKSLTDIQSELQASN